MFETVRRTMELMEANGMAIPTRSFTMLDDSSSSFSLSDYAQKYTEARDAYLQAAEALKLATGPYKAARDAYVAAAATYTKSLYE
mmetsp:Transcript_83544/g.223611  ORF Transcript_83544/g.223611 Transcript_83544/m.223611 type:complete len:85 (-) Transcript_83544:151-405(-)|eukprot:CAMPEP_0113696266 /NCGR_PEP_ID=MMETSP0038_2-20120614/21382_1 /TAXON_ID=2898 /ORGANISM="Cryptomonas paramecium" /LENGTH=84 /DNA_ID=CAMNT_0000618945 /DNA_START=15 /DNA_END=269 /DNA_ORIENTATION=- /assembly_acc=CAM_ASM_000170